MCSPSAARRGTGVKRTQGIDGHAAQSAVKAATARRARQESARSKKPREHAPPRGGDRASESAEPVCWAQAEATNTPVHVERCHTSQSILQGPAAIMSCPSQHSECYFLNHGTVVRGSCHRSSGSKQSDPCMCPYAIQLVCVRR